MNLETFAETVDTLITDLSYPGFEARALKLGLPEQLTSAPVKLFAQALKSENIYVVLASLRWFQTKPGAIKPHTKAMVELLAHPDEWVRIESLNTLELSSNPDKGLAVSVCALLKDPLPSVRRHAAKAVGKIGSKSKPLDEEVLTTLRDSRKDEDAQVRAKVEKALKKLGEYS